MTGISSRSAGVVLVPKPGTSECAIFDIVEGVEKEPFEAQFLYSAAHDWVEIEGNDEKTLLETATREYWLTRTVTHLRMAIGGLEASLEASVFESTEEILGSRVKTEDVLNRLLIAPLADPQCTVVLAKSALSCGFPVVASVLNDLVELQQLLQRLTDLWLGLPDAGFDNLPESKEMIWVTVVETVGMSELLKSGNKHDFEAKWSLLSWCFNNPLSRTGVINIGKELSLRLYPRDRSEKILPSEQIDESEPLRGDEREPWGSDYEAFQRAEKQILVIARAVSEGRDNKAEKYVRQLIKTQTSVSGGVDYAVKSLCNIAQHCADMFRTDFEIMCLDMALELKPTDAWALVQLGDHWKRVGEYEEAVKVLVQAQHYGEADVALSSMADVYAEQGEYDEALRRYKTIPDWKNKSAVLTAIADNLRWLGKMAESEAAYTQLIERAQSGLHGYDECEFRALAGLAEIAKRQGRLDDALSFYKEVLQHELPNDRDKLFYRLGLCNVHKLMENYDKAYKIVGDVIVEYPFAMEAHFIRGSILGLMGDWMQGLADLPQGKGSHSGRDWLRRYYRGLLLFKLERYEDARKNLVDELPKAIASGEGKAILRLGASLWFLREGEFLEADKILSDISDLHDCHLQYLTLVLRLQSATQKTDRDTIAQLTKQIKDLGVVDAKLDGAVKAIAEGDFPLAIDLVTDALLKAAA